MRWGQRVARARRAAIAACCAMTRRARAAIGASTILPSSGDRPSPCVSACASADAMRSARATSSADGENSSFRIATCAGWMHDAPLKPKRRDRRTSARKPPGSSKSRGAADHPQRQHTGCRGGEHQLLLGQQQRVGIDLHAAVQRQVFGAHVQRDDARAGAARSRPACDQAAALSTSAISRVRPTGSPRCDSTSAMCSSSSRRCSALSTFGITRPSTSGPTTASMSRTASDSGAVDAHQHVGAAAAHPRRGRGDAVAGARLLGRGNAVLEVELDAVGAALVRLGDEPLDVRRHVEQRAPDRQVRSHRADPGGASGPRRRRPQPSSSA